MFSALTAASAQVTRAELIATGEDAFFNLEIDRAREFFVAAVNPVVQPPDSIWAIGVQYLTQMHLEAGNPDLADTWMRWAVRLVPDMQVDEMAFVPEVIRRYRSALALVGSGNAGDQVTETTWVWPTLGSRETSGILRISPSTLESTIRVNISGRGSITSGLDLTLPPGTYSLQVSADGYNPTDVTREILPGVTTVLTFNLEPTFVAREAELREDVLSEDVETTARSRLARFTANRYRTDPTCGTGFLVGRDGLILTTYTAIRGAESLDLELADGSEFSDEVSVAAWDTQRNVAVLKVPITSSDSLPLSTAVTDGQRAWAFSHPGCGESQVAQLQIVTWTNRPGGTLRLSDSTAIGIQGGPVVAQSGAVLGLAVGNREAVPADHVSRYLETARQNVREDRLIALETVAEREHHLYGSVMIHSTFENATARVSPLENWQWPETERSGPVPLTYTGPMGRYRLNLQATGQQSHQSEFVVDPGAFKEITEPQIIVAEVGGGGFPWPIALVGAAGAAVVGVVLGMGGGDEPGPVVDDRPGYGWIKIQLPSNP